MYFIYLIIYFYINKFNIYKLNIYIFYIIKYKININYYKLPSIFKNEMFNLAQTSQLVDL